MLSCMFLLVTDRSSGRMTAGEKQTKSEALEPRPVLHLGEKRLREEQFRARAAPQPGPFLAGSALLPPGRSEWQGRAARPASYRGAPGRTPACDRRVGRGGNRSALAPVPPGQGILRWQSSPAPPAPF